MYLSILCIFRYINILIRVRCSHITHRYIGPSCHNFWKLSYSMILSSKLHETATQLWFENLFKIMVGRINVSICNVVVCKSIVTSYLQLQATTFNSLPRSHRYDKRPRGHEDVRRAHSSSNLRPRSLERKSNDILEHEMQLKK